MLIEDTGQDCVVIEGSRDVTGLKHQLFALYPSLQGRQFIIAVNKQKANDSTVLKEDDEIALIPPFAGG